MWVIALRVEPVNVSIRRALAGAFVVASVTATIVAGPVAAYSPPTSDYGNTVTCNYKALGNGPSYNFRLKKFVVTAPVLYAKKGHQTVGWRFVVTRSTTDPWEVTYRSPIQKATATTTTAAAFTTKSVGVTLPDVENISQVQYHVTLKLLWYRANGSVKSQTSYLMPYMISHSKFDDDWANDCRGGFYQGP